LLFSSVVLRKDSEIHVYGNNHLLERHVICLFIYMIIVSIGPIFQFTHRYLVFSMEYFWYILSRVGIVG